jgi:hypothetical protein
MPDPQQQTNEKKENGPAQWFFNRVVRGIPYFQRRGLPKTKKLGGVSPMRDKLVPLLRVNDGKMQLLKTVEGKFKETQEILGRSGSGNFLSGQNGVVATYQRLGQYAGEWERLENEARMFESGSQFSRRNLVWKTFRQNRPQLYQALQQNPQISIAPVMTSYSSFLKDREIVLSGEAVHHADGAQENLFCIGNANTAALISELNNFHNTIVQELQSQGPQTQPLINQLGLAFQSLTQLLSKVREVENGELGKLRALKGEEHNVRELEQAMERLNPSNSHDLNVRFKHTYRVIKPSARNQQALSKQNFVRRPEELEWGLDENGYPLEVGENGDILLDKFWNSLSQEELDNMRSKPGGVEYINTHLGGGRLQRSIGLALTAPADLLDTATSIFGQWDDIIGDVRFGGGRVNSKTVADYLIASFGGFKVPPRVKGGGIVNVDDATEQMVKRGYQMPLHGGGVYPAAGEGVRYPTVLNPAFDRKATRMGYEHYNPMYYYAYQRYGRRWLNNPKPLISTRGIALYLAYLASANEFYFDDAVELLDNHEFDYGERQLGEFGTNNPLSGRGVP